MSDMFDLTMKSITGDDVHFADYRGQVLLLVNVATY